MSVTIEAIKPHIGGIVHADKAQLCDDDVVQACKDALEDRGVLVFPKINLTNAEQLAFTDKFGLRVKFTTAANLVTELDAAQQQHRLDRMLANLERIDLLIVDELGYLSFSRSGAELLFQVFADRYERRSLLITSNLPFGEWGQIFQGERMTAALLDRLTHRCAIFEMNGESYRFRESMKAKKDKDARKVK